MTIDGGDLPRTLSLDAAGSVRFAPVTTDRLRVSFELPLELNSFDPATRGLTPLGVGVSELELGGAPPVPALDPEAAVTIPCGRGPVVTVDGVPRQTSARTTAGELHDLAPVELTLCGPATAALGTGEHRLVATATDTLAVDSATLTRVGSAVAAAGSRTAARITRWDAEDRSVRVAARTEATLLVVPENTNPGWSATLDGHRLETVAVDGWQQGYVLPAGAAGTVELSFGPGLLYRWALGIGAGAVLLLIALAVVRGRPARPAAPSGAPALGRRARAPRGGRRHGDGRRGRRSRRPAGGGRRGRAGGTAAGGGPRRRGGERPGRGGCTAPGRRRRHGDGAPGAGRGGPRRGGRVGAAPAGRRSARSGGPAQLVSDSVGRCAAGRSGTRSRHRRTSGRSRNR